MSIILSNTGEWVTILSPKGHDPSWQMSDHMRYAVLFQKAVDKGFSSIKAEQIAEAIVNRALYPGVVYSELLEEDIYTLLRSE